MAETYGESAAYRPFICSECSRSFTRSENLQRHKRARHGGSSRKSFECAGCRARFSRSDVYKRHGTRCRLLASLKDERRPENRETTPPAMTDSVPLPIVPLEAGENWQAEQATFATDISQAYSGSPSSIENGESTASHIKAYFDHFHPSFPFLHRPTFALSSTPGLLVNIIAVIGSLYARHNVVDSDADARWRRDTWRNGNRELQRLVASDYSEFRKTWVLQAWLLHIIYGAYLKDTLEFEESKRMMRTIVDAVRELGLLRQGITMPDSMPWEAQVESNAFHDDAKTPYTRWMGYIASESLKLALYALVLIDSHLFLPANMRLLISPIEFGWELPFPSNLWDAKDPQIWQRRVIEHFGFVPESYFYGPRGLPTASLSIATQQLMTESPSPELLAALASSPFATLCVLANINALIRDFTRCYYQLPPSPSDPSAFHILTQHQNKQVYSAMRAIAKVVKDQVYTIDNPHFSLWRTVEILHCSVKISLCRPDHLLIGGIVDNSVIAGLATSAHLNLGNYVSVRRSAPLLKPHLWDDEGVLAVLNDLASVLSRITGEEGDGVPPEAPWVTACSYGILLCIWSALKRARQDIQAHLDTFNELPRMSESCMLIFNTLMESVLRLGGVNERDPRIWSTERHAFVSLLEQGEFLFVSLLLKICRTRTVWGIGPSMATVIDEILATPQATTALA
ncbi:hypothetical protein BDW74DRAFT_187984 [Aspergillus multicolor]|uniref:C2H2-type zinc finger protein n=1 Tax=Aspergillus multicolor TaxID=41759 RepID=UPI003CCDE080